MSILIAGAGQLGSRYLQGLATLDSSHKIILVDPAEESLRRAFERFQGAGGSTKNLSAHKEITHALPPIDLAIISSLASTRLQITKALLEKTSVKFLILEKLLAQNIHSIDSLERLTTNTSATWVNTPRRIMCFYNDIKALIKKENPNNTPLHIEVKGGNWGLACNSIHFIDLAEWLTEAHLETCQVQSKMTWQNSKRPGFKEANGKINCQLERGNSLKLINEDSSSSLKIKVQSQHIDLEINEQEGMAMDYRRDFKIHGHMELQSELTGPLVKSILKKQICLLPSLKTSARQHRIFLQTLAEDFFSDQIAKEPERKLPIT